MPDIKQSLRDFVATSNSGKYSDEKVLLSKFPELSGYDINSLKDFVATSNSGKYADENELLSKFPEFKTGAQPKTVQPPAKKKKLESPSAFSGIISSLVPSVKTEQQPAVSSSVKKAEIPQAVDIAKLNPDIKRDKTKDGLYTFPDQETAVYKKQNGQWLVDVNKSGNFQPLTKGDVEARSKNLDARAIPLGYEERTTYLAKEKDGTKTSLEQEVAKINSFMKDYDWEAKKEAELKARGQVERKLTPSQLRNDPRTPKLTYNNNEYRINRLTDGTESWEKKDKLSGDFFVISDPNSITLLNKKLGGKVPIESPLFEETRKSHYFH
jgi:hypothetical protein